METHILFFILAGVLIALLVGYSLWSARREKSRIDTLAMRPVSVPPSSNPAPHFETQAKETSATTPEGMIPAQAQFEENPAEWQQQEQEIQQQVQGIKITLGNAAEEAVQPEPIYQQAQTVNNPVSETTTDEAPAPAPEPDNNLVTLYMVAPQGTQFSGMAVVQQLEALGLRYGDYQIFHRYQNGETGPVLFSVANMMQPGIFDMTTIEQFSTVGLVFFMQLPSPTNDMVNVKLMLDTADSLAQMLGGFILNDQQQLLDENARQAYFQRVRRH